MNEKKLTILGKSGGGGGGGDAVWGSITGTISNQTDLMTELNKKADINSVPTKTSDLNNDSGFITISDVPAQVQSNWGETDTDSPAYIVGKPSLATVATTGSYTDLSNTPSIPDAVSGTNDGTNWTSITIGNVTKAIPNGGGGVSQIQSDWTQTDNTQVDFIKNKPTLGTMAAETASDYTKTSGLANVAISGSYSDLSNTPTIPDAVSGVNDGSNWTSITIGSVTKSIPAAQVNSDWNAVSGVTQILNKPTLGTMAAETASDYTKTSGLATVAISGSYADLSNTPTIPAAQIQSDWNQSDNTQLDFIKNKPSIPDVVSGTNDGTNWTSITIGSTTKSIPAAQVQANWNETNSSSAAYIQNKPTIPAAQVNSDWNASSGVTQILNKPSMSTETLTFIDTNNVSTTVIVYIQPTI